jgi:hypothetical protein
VKAILNKGKPKSATPKKESAKNTPQLALELRDLPEDSNGVERAVRLCEILDDKKRQIEDLTESLSELQKSVDRLEQEEIPLLLQELKLKRLELFDGTVVELTDFVSASIPKDRRDEAFSWLIDNDFGGLVKVALKIEFGRGDRDKATEAAEKLIVDYEQLQMTEDVHASTLKAWVKERLEAGETLPTTLFGIHQSYRVKLTKPKTKR